jgi:hypothetical protein
VTRLLSIAFAAALVLPAAALGGGWATVQLDSTPDGLSAGQAWSVQLTVLQHGRTPLEGITPTIRVMGPNGDRSFTAAPTSRPGVYAAEVVFPSAGTWDWEIWDGFSQTHTYYPVQVGPADGGAGDGGFSWWAPAPGAGALALAALGALAFLLVRRRRPHVRVA